MNNKRISLDFKEGKSIAFGESSPPRNVYGYGIQNIPNDYIPSQKNNLLLSVSEQSAYRSSSVPTQSPPLPPISKKIADAFNSAACISPSPIPSTQPQASSNFTSIQPTLPLPEPSQNTKYTIDPSSNFNKKRAVKDFHFGRILGEGSYSTVVEATEISTEKIYAAKILDKRHIIKEKKTKYVTIERNVLHKLNHPFIINLHYTFQDTRSLYFIIDLAENGELLNYVRKFGGLTENCTRFYLAEIVLAVEYMHNNGVVHRDLKPENILLGKDMNILITDFGTAKVLDDSDHKSSDLRSNSFVGTAEYVSPELLMNKSSGKSSDIWALGCIAYQLLSGRPPFKGANEYQTFQKILHNEYEFPPHFSNSAKNLIEKILVLEPKNRLGSGHAGISEIKQHDFFEGIDWNALQHQPPPTMQGLLARTKSDCSSAPASEYLQAPLNSNSGSSADLNPNSESVNSAKSPPKIPPKPKDFTVGTNTNNITINSSAYSSVTNNRSYEVPGMVEPILSNKNAVKSSLAAKYIDNAKFDSPDRIDIDSPIRPYTSSEIVSALHSQELLYKSSNQAIFLPRNVSSSHDSAEEIEISSRTNGISSTRALNDNSADPITIINQPHHNQIQYNQNISPYTDPRMNNLSSPDEYSKSMRISRPFKKRSRSFGGYIKSCFTCGIMK
ncbi:3-phosphoinositide-dependent protein kinase 1 [Smittium culicis]|uniref:non-specific serine/threonine protein kinase n=1 Tax=Smittium culicis TaxID=133412 RepID=A0A1R1XQ24_9FUNG|nr:3-phosphoinositide-dependent protein kinase 1 [Smittium culicis]